MYGAIIGDMESLIGPNTVNSNLKQILKRAP